ncbi:primosomal protein N' [Microlunatus ginsengisoli]|uniref:Probable replication restart protein PriA n=1 Tax=Microlunatus ginsengisoli TaxID=363863 RepID=A0ABP7AF05_9ACTN
MSETPALPVARVALDVSLAHLDRPFDYAVTAEQDLLAVPGARVRARFAGRLRDGFVLERVAASEHGGDLTALHKVVSAEPVLSAEVASLIRAVADHYAGTFADVMRLAVPPRHAATERASRPEPPPAPDVAALAGPLAHYPSGAGLLDAIRAGAGARAAWQTIPTSDPAGDWAEGLAEAARACVDGGRGAVLVVPDHRDLARLTQACTRWLGTGRFTVLSADAGPSARYRAFLAAARGDVPVVIGTRAAAFAPVGKLGLVALWDDGDDLLAEQRAPYPHARDVLALRAAQTGCAVLFAGYARTAEIEQWVADGWLRELAASRADVRREAPAVRVSAASDFSLARDPLARQARLPHEVFELMRAALPQGPVLVQVPRAGYLVALVCQDCREPARCGFCDGPLRGTSAALGALSCGWCGRPQGEWRCPICDGSRVRAPVVGATRTAEELGRAFPQTPVRRSAAGHVLDEVPAGTSIVVATPGAEPDVDGGYAAAVLLDTQLLLLRPDLRAGEESLRRWLRATALVRPGADGGSVLAVGDSSGRALQALVRVDPAGFAARELADRADARFPPAAVLVSLEGPPAALAELLDLVELPEGAEALGPVDLPPGASGDPLQRLLLRAPRARRTTLTRAVKGALGVRSARKSEGAIRCRVDPVEIS